jgi:hypothetical protein
LGDPVPAGAASRIEVADDDVVEENVVQPPRSEVTVEQMAVGV